MCFCNTGLYFINNFSIVDTVSYGSVEGVFRASFDKSRGVRSAGHQDAARDSFFLFSIMVQILEHPYIKFHWKLKAKELLS